jgi:hypothetical protein
LNATLHPHHTLDGLLSLLLPAARQLDASADAVAQSQLTLIEEIDKLNAGVR